MTQKADDTLSAAEYWRNKPETKRELVRKAVECENAKKTIEEFRGRRAKRT